MNSRTVGRMLVGACALAGLVGLGPRPAAAKLFELQLKVHAGGIAGVAGAEKWDPANQNADLAGVAGTDFFIERRGGAFGGTFNVEVFFVDLTYEFYQLVDGKGLGSTLNNFLVGFDWDFNPGRWVITPYVHAGFGLATQNSDWLAKAYPQAPSIGLEDLQSRIVMVRAGVTLERRLGRFFRLGLDVGFGYHYAMQTAYAANDLDGHSHGFHVLGNVYLSFAWNPFERKRKPEDAAPGPLQPTPPPPTPDPPPAPAVPPQVGGPTSAPPAPAPPAPPARKGGAPAPR
jgi:hypothetical protein